MGINKLWDEIGDGELISWAALAAGHFKENGRPLRVAVDAPVLCYKNVTPEKVGQIQKICAPSNPMEKNIMYFIFRLKMWGIQLLCVFDGVNKPKKEGRNTSSLMSEQNKLYKEMLINLGVGVHDAPAEAEAECARLQMLGHADAVYTNDGDALMFGCTMLLKKCTEKPTTTTHVRVFRSEEIEARIPGLDRDGFAVYCLLNGGDYHKAGVKGVGPQKALEAMKHVVPEDKKYLGSSLRKSMDEGDIHSIRSKLCNFLGKSMLGYPFEPLHKLKELAGWYMNPLVSSDEKLRKYSSHSNWNFPIEDGKDQLKNFLVRNFNIDAKDYNRWVVPVLFVGKVLGGNLNFKELGLVINKVDTMKNVGKGSKVSFIFSAVTELVEAFPDKDPKYAMASIRANVLKKDAEELEMRKKKAKAGQKCEHCQHENCQCDKRVQADFLDYILDRIPAKHKVGVRVVEKTRKPRVNTQVGQNKKKGTRQATSNRGIATQSAPKPTKRKLTEMSTKAAGYSGPVKKPKHSVFESPQLIEPKPRPETSSKNAPSDKKGKSKVIDPTEDSSGLAKKPTFERPPQLRESTSPTNSRPFLCNGKSKAIDLCEDSSDDTPPGVLTTKSNAQNSRPTKEASKKASKRESEEIIDLISDDENALPDTKNTVRENVDSSVEYDPYGLENIDWSDDLEVEKDI